MNGRRACASLLALGLTACAPRPELDVAAVGSGVAATLFEIAPTEASGPWREPVARALGSQGWTAATEAPVRVEISPAMRSGAVGARPPEPQSEPAWIVEPRPRRWWERSSAMLSLTLTAVDAETGAELGRSTAVLRTAPSRGADPEAWRLLSEEAAAALAAGSARTGSRQAEDEAGAAR